MSARSDEDAIHEAIVAVESITWDESLVWRIHEPLVLFDSVHDGDESTYERDELKPDVLRITVAPGPYLVRAAHAYQSTRI
ncbi:hypothetical protein J5X84_33495 [Streptosporangiaceae bacterium NEAU-GS5]|nr:hypothetical protein [Streptosporangiaceae bacterium NEAU-GS5]